MLRFYTVSYIEIMKLPMQPDETKFVTQGKKLPYFLYFKLLALGGSCAHIPLLD